MLFIWQNGAKKKIYIKTFVEPYFYYYSPDSFDLEKEIEIKNNIEK